MKLLAGTTVTLTVLREVPPYGYFIANERSNDQGDDVLLPYHEAETKLEPGDDVNVFLFHDSKDRLTATTKQPSIHLGELACLQVADIHSRFGCFLEMGIGRQLLLPSSELPEEMAYWPIVGDRMYVKMVHDKQERMLAKAADEFDFERLVFAAPSDWVNRHMTAIVYKKLQMGDFVIVDGGVLGFGAIGLLHSSERIRSLRVGEQIEVRITYVREDGRVNVSMKAVKEISRGEDAEKILTYLKARPNGAMPYSDLTAPDLIKQKFDLSKSAFKRALGKLMKDGLVEQKENWTHLIEGNKREEE